MSTHENNLLHATESRDIDEVRKLLDEGADPSVKGNSGSTPLHSAAKENILEAAELLLECGADPNAEEYSGSTPLHYAAQNGHDKIVQLLLEYWADPNAKNDSGTTPLHNAAKGDNPIVVKLLLESGADLEAEDEYGSKPEYYAVQDIDIARLFLGLPVAPKVAGPQQQKDMTPMFPITINGNTLDQSILSAPDASNTNYVLVQTWARPSPSQRKDLEIAGLQHLDYVSKNTYLCHYQDANLASIRLMELVVYVDVYRLDFKIAPSLKGAEPDGIYEVDVIFHEGVNSNSTSLQELVTQKVGPSSENIEFVGHKARLGMQGRFFNHVALLDEVRCIEEVGEVVEYNDVARRILNFDIQPLAGQQQTYQGSGQIVTVADSGLDRGQANPIHHAFAGRVRRWYAIHNSTEDHTGHGTHVCGSAVGNGQTKGTRVMGTAPQAHLAVQSIWDPIQRRLRPPGDLTHLFDPPYQNEAARVHSNSWGRRRKSWHNPAGPALFRQMDYTTGASEIDEFVYDHQEMVICFAAGNNGKKPVDPLDRGHIGAEAAAKNCITVGASQSTRHGEDQDVVANFSSRGPTKKGRRKPDVVAPGTDILSACSRNLSKLRGPSSGPSSGPGSDPGSDPNWCYKSGTSMATPLVAGCAAVLREALIAHGTGSPSAALIKALLINGAEILSQPMPNIESGFGRVNIANSITVAQGEPGTGFHELELSDSAKQWRSDEIIKVEPRHSTLKATLVWSDPAGNEIKNRLRLEVRHTSGPKYGRSDNNVQQVLWSNISPGEVRLRVGIVAKDLDKSPQRFAVVWRLH